MSLALKLNIVSGRLYEIVMETIFERKEFFDKNYNELANRMEAVEKLCTICNVECAQVNGKWGIGLKVNDSFMLIDPIDLVSSIYKSECWLSLRGEENIGTFIVECRKEEFCYEWLLTHTMLKKAGCRFFTFTEYQSKITEAINKLYQKFLDGSEIVYEPIDADKESVELCVKQLAIKWAQPSNFRRQSSEITVDKFYFNPGKEAEKYFIGLSDRGFQSWITDWDNDYDEIRHRLENYVYRREATIRLGFDMSDTIITFNHKSVLKSVEESFGGYGFRYDDRCLVSIETDDIGKAPVLKGYCEERPTIRTFYEGLLLMCLNYMEDPDGYIYDIRAIDGYNKMKSPIIEQWLKKENRDYNSPIKRQTVVDKIWIINPEYDVCVEEISSDRVLLDVVDDIFEDVVDANGNAIVIPSFSAWAKEISEIIIKSETGKEYTFDWEDYHKRGLELAKQLRSKLPSNIDLWYSAPFEDKSLTIPRPILISQ